MKIYQNGKQCNIDALVEEYKCLLKKDIVVLLTEDHLHHIAAYSAWQEVGGQVQVINPLLTDAQKNHLKKQAQESPHTNCVFMHTSGTTGLPKLVVHTPEQFNQIVVLNSTHFEHSSDTHFLSIFPASTSAFWHIVVTPLYHFNSSVTLSTTATLEKSFNEEKYTTVFVPAVVEYLSKKSTNLDFSNFKLFVLGGGQVQKKHVEYLVNSGCKKILHSFGATETGSPLLARRVEHCNDPDWTSLQVPEGTEVKLVEGELWVRGSNVCKNYNEIRSSENWYRTGDIWEQDGDLIKFLGRSDDFVDVNNRNINLVELENTIEELGLGTATIYKKSRLGVDFLTLEYTNVELTTSAARSLIKNELSKEFWPRKIYQVDDVPRSVLGKKMRIK